MGRELVLPFTCEAGEIMLRILWYTGLIGFPLMVIIGIIVSEVTLLIICGMFGTLLWLVQIMTKFENNDWNIRCKCDGDK